MRILTWVSKFCVNFCRHLHNFNKLITLLRPRHLVDLEKYSLTLGIRAQPAREVISYIISTLASSILSDFQSPWSTCWCFHLRRCFLLPFIVPCFRFHPRRAWHYLRVCFSFGFSNQRKEPMNRNPKQIKSKKSPSYTFAFAWSLGLSKRVQHYPPCLLGRLAYFFHVIHIYQHVLRSTIFHP